MSNPEYSRKLKVAAEIADDAWIKSGVEGMERELIDLRRLDADPVVIAELERITRRQIVHAFNARHPKIQ